ncbi:ThuA domain-containing protein [Paenibacillus sp. MWE-103]|uniref:ThuA domain-containing protein n=1 Tax=Paenibacillus artemisiicola TaxID=1172618 RepID=A0ABS3WIM6_9BACL|nr:ThuA domain-containing protein [Paenibacillus artemisiicola]MBO7748152.1 ThuA domain-containing protein [Paenibacillus artemisiicola]
MNEPVRTLLLGDFAAAPWHPLEPARAELDAALGPEFALEATEDYDALSRLDHAEHPLCISYADCWDRTPTPAQTAGLLRYVAGGGGLLVVHNGISLQRSPELRQLIGARFTGHPPYQPLVYRPAEEHPILGGVGEFPLEEEPYRFELDPLAELDVFLAYDFEGERCPAGWARDYGLGRVVYLQPGHHAPSFRPEPYRRLLLNGARWACRR